jgi:chromosome partitioning protein
LYCRKNITKIPDKSYYSSPPIGNVIAYTTYSEAGGVGKTTLATNLAHLHARHGQNVLTIDLDPQQGSLTYLLDIQTQRDNPDVDNIARHLIGRPKGSIAELIHETPHGFDVIPSHNMLANLQNLLNQANEMADELGDQFNPNDRLRQVLSTADVTNTYDIIIVDPPATAGAHLYNAIAATRSLVIPVEPTGKGVQSVEGLEDMVMNLGEQFDFNVGVLAVVPNRIGQTTDHQRYLTEFDELGYDIPVMIRDRTSLFEGCWNERCTAVEYIENHRSQQREYELQTIEKLQKLATHIEEVGSQ